LKKPYIEVGKKAVKHIRITLFTPEEIEKIELENRKEPFIPVSIKYKDVNIEFRVSDSFLENSQNR